MSGRPKRALVVDDIKAMRAVLTTILKKLGYEQVLLAQHGLEAIDKLNSVDYIDLVVSDFNMPCLNGTALLKKIRTNELRHYARVPFIMVTTEANVAEIKETVMSYPFTDLLQKPFTPEKLGDILKELVDDDEA